MRAAVQHNKELPGHDATVEHRAVARAIAGWGTADKFGKGIFGEVVCVVCQKLQVGVGLVCTHRHHHIVVGTKIPT